MTFSNYEYSMRKWKTRREEFLNIMNEIIPWEEWVEFVRSYYPNGKRGRPTKGIEKMLRMYLFHIWFNLSDEKVEIRNEMPCWRRFRPWFGTYINCNIGKCA